MLLTHLLLHFFSIFHIFFPSHTTLHRIFLLDFTGINLILLANTSSLSNLSILQNTSPCCYTFLLIFLNQQQLGHVVCFLAYY